MLKKTIVSIDIGNRLTKIVEGYKQGQHIYVQNNTIFKTPDNTVRNGEIIDEKVLKRELHRQLIKINIKHKKAVCIINSTNIFVREFIFPSVNKLDLIKLINYEIEEYFPILLKDYIIEHKIIDKIYDTNHLENSSKLKVLVVAIPFNVAETYYNMLKDLNLKPKALDISSNAIGKIISLNNNDMSYYSDDTLVFIDIGYRYTNVNIFHKGILKTNKLLIQGSEDIDSAIANSLNITIEDAEEIKSNNIELVQNNIFKKTIEIQLKNIQKVIDYYTSRVSGNVIDTIILYGGGSMLKGIKMYYESFFKIKVYLLEHFNYIKYTNKHTNLNNQLYFNAISNLVWEKDDLD